MKQMLYKFDKDINGLEGLEKLVSKKRKLKKDTIYNKH